ncbi:MAG: nucleotidyl transferase AbiEii/AbiGii toxin family protein [Phycisphaerales bacterium]|nr:nucleotidyl transferase AbiEii/AbiGii toxin family protein [Phycisphaerales bacterium]
MTRQPKDGTALVHQMLRNAAQRSGERFNDMLQHFALERFLHRLAMSPYRDRFTLKGALMLRVWKVSQLRPTSDIDLLGHMPNQSDRVAVAMRRICETEVEPDGMIFDASSVSIGPIGAAAEYEGLRVKFHGRLGRARLPMRIDIAFGDQVTPGPVEIEYPSLIGMPVSRLTGYTPETAIAEKLHVMLDRGRLNSRLKDFFDVWALTRAREFDGCLMTSAIRRTCARREMVIAAAHEAFAPHVLRDPAKDAQWAALRKRIGGSGIPGTFAEVREAVAAFANPVLASIAEGRDLAQHWPPGGPWR